jgi:phosphate transport system substrate-binding protein
MAPCFVCRIPATKHHVAGSKYKIPIKNQNKNLPTLLQIMKKSLSLLAVIAIATAGASAQDKIVIKGSDTLGAKMLPQLSEAYKAAGNEANFEIAAEGSSSAFTNLLAGTADIGMSSRDVKDSEKNEFTSKGMDLKEHVAGADMIAVVLNEANKISELTLEQVEGIFTGDISDWSEVGGLPGAISVYTRNTASGTYKSFQEMAMNNRDYGADSQKMAGNEQIAEEVSKNANGIGYVGLAYAGKDGIKSAKIDGHEADPKEVDSYPIARKLYYYTVAGKVSEAAAKFLEWAMSDDVAKKVVERVGFIPNK